ncbi:MAG: response regulator [Spirochaetaceae bacterium]|jgi:two-component system OmpR family response regulator|nr:response regulator [Spirochaetaceae bacterium]
MAKQNILIIDDDEDIIETVSILLENEGFNITSSDNVEDGLEMIKSNPPDLVLLDIMFPEKKTRGFEAAAQIKEINSLLPVFAFTAINREYSFDFSKEEIQADEFINKPVATEKLVELIKKYL